MRLLVLLYLPKFIITLLIIVAVFYGFRFISRYIVPYIVKRFVNNMQNQMKEEQRTQQRRFRNEGDVTVEYRKNKQNNANGRAGDYVDFEEVE